MNTYIEPFDTSTDNLLRYQLRLQEWKDELQTNTHGMQYLAQRAIDLLQRDIDYWWPHCAVL